MAIHGDPIIPQEIQSLAQGGGWQKGWHFFVEAAHFLIHDAMNPYKRNQMVWEFHPQILWFRTEVVVIFHWKDNSETSIGRCFFQGTTLFPGHTFDPLGFIAKRSSSCFHLLFRGLQPDLLEGRPFQKPLAAKFFLQFLPKWISPSFLGNIPKNDPVW